MSKNTNLPVVGSSSLLNDPVRISRLTNNELKKNLTKMSKALNSMSRDVWTLAIATHTIISGECYKDDFGTLSNLAEVLDTTKGNLSKYYNAVALLPDLEAYGYDTTNMPYSNVYPLSTLKEDFTAFMDYYHETDLGKLSKAQIEEIVKRFKDRNVVADIVVVDEAEVEEAETEAEAEAEAKKGSIEAYIVDGILTFTYRKKLYNIPVKELKDYIVKE